MVRRQADLILVVACSLALSAVILALPAAPPARVALGLPFVLFFPGYALAASLSPRKDDLGPVERVALGLGLSIAAVPLMGLGLHYSPWGIRLQPLLGSLTLLIVLASAVAAVRRWLLPADQAFAVTADLRWLRLPRALAAGGFVALALPPLAAALVIAGYLLAAPQPRAERFTEFYVLGPDGQAQGYPSFLRLGERTSVTLGLANHEGRETAYRVLARIGGESLHAVGDSVLRDGDRWQHVVALVPTRAGDGQKVEFLLYREGLSEPYRRLHLWIDVEDAPAPTHVAAGLPSPTPAASPTATQPQAEVLAQQQAPAPAETTADAPATPQPRQHVVAPGENLTRIALQWGVPLDAVIAANDLDDPDLIYPQQVILIPAGGATGGSQ